MKFKKASSQEYTFARVYRETHEKLKELAKYYGITMISFLEQVVNHQHKEMRDELESHLQVLPESSVEDSGPDTVENG